MIRAMATPPDAEELARRYVTLWQEQMLALAADLTPLPVPHASFPEGGYFVQRSGWAAEDRFLIFTHPEMHEYVDRKAADTDRWIRGMTRLWERSQQLLADQPPG